MESDLPYYALSANNMLYRSGTVNSNSFISKDFLRINWEYELTVHFKHEIIHRNFELRGTLN